MIKDKVTIITGAASGIGLAIAKVFLENGAKVVLADLNEDKLIQETDALKSQGYDCMPIKVNVTDEQAVKAMINQTVEQYGRLDILFNNAGINEHVKFEDMPYNRWVKNMDVNINSMVLVSQAVGKVMIEQKKGSIINTSSMSGIIVNTPQPQAAYNTSKGAV
ncbi:SDR family NAD(P)-dependent oxidoreductase, partial [Enterococcus faecalis]|uniref:SDR family NAD(P)-dependent oxidoreductase n=1 Tax=Enterococcus faecalis TaxID=1351 RepID=UPI0024585E4D